MVGFKNILAQEAAIAELTRAFGQDRLSHGLIFAGPAGVGKRTTADALAGLFLCESPRDVEPCGACASCRAFEGGNHPDYHVITKELIRYHDKTGKSKGIDLSINVILPEVVEAAGRKAAMGRGKVFIIEQAELMNPHAQNALLKTLEEPAGRTLVILLTDQPGLLLPTIRSRCQIIAFATLPPDLVRSELQKRGVNGDIAVEAAKLAGGSLGTALKWIEDDVVRRAGEVTALVDSILSGQPADALPAALKQAAEAYAEKQLERDKLSSKDAANREGLTIYLRIIAERIRRQLDASDDPDELEAACSAIDAIYRAEQYLEENVNIALVLQQLSLALQRRSQILA